MFWNYVPPPHTHTNRQGQRGPGVHPSVPFIDSCPRERVRDGQASLGHAPRAALHWTHSTGQRDEGQVHKPVSSVPFSFLLPPGVCADSGWEVQQSYVTLKKQPEEKTEIMAQKLAPDSFLFSVKMALAEPSRYLHLNVILH